MRVGGLECRNRGLDLLVLRNGDALHPKLSNLGKGTNDHTRGTTGGHGKRTSDVGNHSLEQHGRGLLRCGRFLKVADDSGLPMTEQERADPIDCASGIFAMQGFGNAHHDRVIQHCFQFFPGQLPRLFEWQL